MQISFRNLRSFIFTSFVLLTVAAQAVADLRDDVLLAIRVADFRDATVGVSVRDAESGSELVSINADDLMIPASNLKLFTTGAALHVLGPQFEFKTQLLLDGDKLIVVSDGDPGFGDPQLLRIMAHDGITGYDVEQFMAIWVDSVVEAGIKVISEVVVDDRVFDRNFIHPDWPKDQLERHYCAQVSGLNFHLNVFYFYPRLSNKVRPNINYYFPKAPWLEIINRGTTRRGPDERDSAWVSRKPGTNDLTFHGNVKGTYRKPVRVTCNNMPDFFAHLLMDRLQKAGVQVSAARTIMSHETKSQGQQIGPVILTPISTVITRCNRESVNLYAEALLKRVGHEVTNEPGSWENGTAIVRHTIHNRLGNPNLAKQIRISDGSGLSRDNRVAAQTMTAWLNTFHHDEIAGEMFIKSIAIAGREGTVRNRFRNEEDLHGAEVRAKSGYINNVSCLSGYVTMPDGQRKSFSILVNGLRGNDALSHAKKMQERIVSAIAWNMAGAVVQIQNN
ncbi:MAG: D-alanyl-D-alanine carboxypeptidase/D-alanyl-D-alanine-endopeptidase [Planctomycetes bacterium]|nr:D-alanyl-D-alanine carboxypeptidase/D-alanyl-D-alanine-endopeptidase [Planctomycetota bacterium]